MPKVKDIDIKKLSTTKREFVFALKKVSQQIDNGRFGDEENQLHTRYQAILADS